MSRENVEIVRRRLDAFNRETWMPCSNSRPGCEIAISRVQAAATARPRRVSAGGGFSSLAWPSSYERHRGRDCRGLSPARSRHGAAGTIERPNGSVGVRDGKDDLTTFPTEALEAAGLRSRRCRRRTSRPSNARLRRSTAETRSGPGGTRPRGRVAWPMIQVVGGEGAVYRGHEGYRELARDLFGVSSPSFRSSARRSGTSATDLVVIGQHPHAWQRRVELRPRRPSPTSSMSRTARPFGSGAYLDPQGSPRSRRTVGVGNGDVGGRTWSWSWSPSAASRTDLDYLGETSCIPILA